MLYDRDFYEWTRRNAELLRTGRIADADLEHIAEEIEDMGKRDKRELRSRLAVLLGHLLKYKIQPERRSEGWLTTIGEQRLEIELILADSPSLRASLEESIRIAWRHAARLATRETGHPKKEFPPSCPFTVEQILDEDYLP